MARGQAGIMTDPGGYWNDRGEWCEAACDPRYTQESTSSDYVRSHDQMKDAQIRKPKLSKGLAFREKI
jgi:hypothetical protein